MCNLYRQRNTENLSRRFAFSAHPEPVGVADERQLNDEQVKAPTMSRLVEGLVRDGLATRDSDPGNRRRVRIAATAEGVRLLEAGGRRRVAALTGRLARLADSEQRALARAVELLERVVKG